MNANLKSSLRPSNAVRSRVLEDAETRQLWDRTAPARAIATRLVSYRADHGLTQTKLGKRLGMSQPAIARLESGEHLPTLDMLMRISDALGIEVLVDFRPQARAEGWVSLGDSDARIVEDVTTGSGGQVVVALS